MRFHKIVLASFVFALNAGIVNATVVEDIKASEEGAKKFSPAPKLIEADGEKVFTAPPKSYPTYCLPKVKVDPAKKYRVSVKLKQNGDVAPWVYIGFIPYDIKNRCISPHHGFLNTPKSMTALTADVAKGAKSITVKDASAWKSGKYYFVAFNVKEDMSDIPNFELAGLITKIEKTGDVYTIEFSKPLAKDYPAGTKVRQHRAAGTYIYTKCGKAPKEWTVWKGWDAYGKALRQGVYLKPMIMINARQEGSGVIFTDFKYEEIPIETKE
ncbi:MAG: hypothetical protein WC082_13260 [Victivallales bacterium]